MRISGDYMEQVVSAESVEPLLPVIQKFIELEHATIPPYLCAFFTIHQGSNAIAADIIRSVVVEEMLHLTIACNLMNALGGSPAIDTARFVPDYPGQLPFGIGDHFKVNLRKCSVDQVRDVFMKIEEPEQPIDVPVTLERAEMHAAMMEQDLTIGALYQALSLRLQQMEHEAQSIGHTIFTGDPARQVVPHKWFPDTEEMFAIRNIEDAKRAINVIIDQGEGTSKDPFDESGEPAHYYRFEQIVEGKLLVHRPGQNPPYTFGGDAVELDMSNIHNMDDNPKISKYKEGSYSRRMATQFSYNYTKLLKSLHTTYNGDPNGIDHAMGVMYELRMSAVQALETPAVWSDDANTDDKQTGLSFEYVTVNT